MRKEIEVLILGIILLFSGWIRFSQLGYSHFYGDEIKTLYLRKDVSAYDFLMNQRKGPVQFLVSWTMEKVTGSYSEFWIRFPYALAGTLLVLLVYLYTRQNFGTTVAIISSCLFSLNGMYIAFSRTAQYQMFYMLFGFLVLVLVGLYSAYKKPFLLFLGGFSLGLAFLTHYDALFFLIPIYFVSDKRAFLKILTVCSIIASLFYIPNLLAGYFETNTIGYLTKRLEGSDYIKNNSLYTFMVYNPLYLYILVILLGLMLLTISKTNHRVKHLLWWLAIPFVAFQLIILNPGTHIHNYFLPLILLSSLGFGNLYSLLKTRFLKLIYTVFLVLIFLVIFAVQSWVYNPVHNTGYPWSVMRPSANYHLYLYGFPYYKSWDKIGQILSKDGRPRNFYTNDNETVAYYYLGGIPHIPPGSNFSPHYYIEVDNPQQIGYKQPVDKGLYDMKFCSESGDYCVYVLKDKK